MGRGIKPQPYAPPPHAAMLAHIYADNHDCIFMIARFHTSLPDHLGQTNEQTEARTG